MASETPEFSTSQTDHAQTHGADDETLSPLEQEVLDEYARLLGNLNNMSSLLLTLSNAPSAAILDGLRGLERKTSLVFTLLKASVYSIVLNQQIGEDNDEDGSLGGRGRGGSMGSEG
ncbi:DASH complex subunit Dad3-domain-containing protein [Paraphoma chrysanthemicola]|uniref:DASH complex subunit DAD3 n=1 Tax=Paraphoma chrysanthemicola TaxID=798071 RepID=A0A8K0W542_9PLEO|nr:DASH complex subunit Dad3-domain-containing protein [Paraphoma chrysanthemicola]